MASLPADLYPAATTILYGLLGAAMGIIAYFLRDIRQSVKEKQQEQEQKLESLRKDMTNLKESLPHKYVLRDDFVRAIAGLDHKIDTICKEIGDISKGLNRLIGGIKESE